MSLKLQRNVFKDNVVANWHINRIKFYSEVAYETKQLKHVQ